jgi:hypothetical protein
MKKTVLTYGLISGGILVALMAITIPLCMNRTLDSVYSEVFGYTSMVLAFILVFLGIRSYRDNTGGGAITFGKAFTVGLLITLVTSAMYVTAWEIIYYGFIPDFADKYSVLVVEKMEKKGASAAAIEKTKADMARFRKMYKNPFFNIGMTLMEVFPVGLVMTLVSAGILRRKPAMAT